MTRLVDTGIVPGEAQQSAQKIVRYRRDFRAFASEQLRIGDNPFNFWPCQTPLLESIEKQMEDRGFARCIWLKSRQVGACVSLTTRVLKTNFAWVYAKDIEVGDEVIATDEFPPGGKGRGRKLRCATVVARREVVEPAFHLLLDNGESLMATGDHRFLCGASTRRKTRSKRDGSASFVVGTVWKHVNEMRIGEHIRFITHPWGMPEYEDGWVGGMIDGEGSGRGGVERPRTGAELTITQAPGEVLDRVLQYLKCRGYTYRVDVDERPAVPGGKFGSRPICKIRLERMGEIFRLVGQTRPTKSRYYDWWFGKDLPGRGYGSGTAWPKVISITPVGIQTMIDLQTTTGTFIAEGFVSHNSTLAEGIVAWRTMLWPHVNALVLADQAERARTLFEISRTFYDHLDDDIRPVGRYITKRELVFANPSQATRKHDPGLQSRIVVESAHKKNIAIGSNWQIVHGSECARYPDPAFVLDGVIPAVHRVPGTIIILESSAEMAGTWYRDLCEASARGDTAFAFTFVPWYLQPEYCIPLRQGEHLDLSANERHIIAEFGLTPGHIKWMREKLSELGNDWDLFRQSFPLTVEDAWVTPGAQVFPAKSLRELRHGVRPPMRMAEVHSGPRILDAPQGKLWIWDEPEQGKAYDIGVDVAMGQGRDDSMEEDFDLSVACVLQRGSNKQVAEWTSRAVDPFELANVLYWLGKYYNTAQIAVETNGIGGGTNQQLSKMGYSNTYVWRYRDEIVPRYSRKTGWETNSKSKPWLVGFASHEMVNGRVHIASESLLRELEMFVQKGPNEWGAVAGHHDDRCLSWMIALLTSDDESFEKYYGLQKLVSRDTLSAGAEKREPEPWECDRTFRRMVGGREDEPWE